MRSIAFKYLAKREYAPSELREKLIQAHGFFPVEVDLLIDDLICQDILSELRFVEIYLRSKARRGYGPNYCRKMLLKLDISSEKIDEGFALAKIDWHEVKEKLKQKKLKEIEIKKAKALKAQGHKTEGRKIGTNQDARMNFNSEFKLNLEMHRLNQKLYKKGF